MNIMPLLQQLLSERPRFLMTLAMLSGFMALGVSVGIKGPTLLDLRQQVNASLTGISFALTGRAAGFVVGSVVRELISESHKNERMVSLIACCCSWAAVRTTGLPADVWRCVHDGLPVDTAGAAGRQSAPAAGAVHA